MTEKRSRYKVYSPLTTSLGRCNIKHSGKNATLLLDVFLKGDITEWQTIDRALVVTRGIVPEKRNKCMDSEDEEYTNYTDWRHHMCLSGFLEWRLKGIGLNKVNNHLGGLFKPGEKLIPYLNKEALKYGQVAMKTDIYKLTDRIDKLEKLVYQAIEEEDPPATKEKLERKLKLIK